MAASRPTSLAGSRVRRASVLAGVLVVLCSLLVVLPARKAFASGPTLSLSTSTISSGGTVTVSGSGFTPSATMVVWLDKNNNNVLDVAASEPTAVGSDPTIMTFTTDSSGAFGNLTLTPSAIAAGTYPVSAGYCNTAANPSCDQTAGVASAQLTISFSVVPSQFGSGEFPAVSGGGLTPGESVTVWFDKDNDNDSSPSSGDPSQNVTVGSDGTFSTTALGVFASPGDYSIRAVPSGGGSTTSAPVHIDSCWFQECIINKQDTICLLGNSPSDLTILGVTFADCKVVEEDYSDPSSPNYQSGNVPPGGYDLTNDGARFPGAGALAAMSNLEVPFRGCAAMIAAIATAEGDGEHPADSGLDLTKPFNDLTDLTCGDPFPPIPSTPLTPYAIASALVGNPVPDAGVLELLEPVADLADAVIPYVGETAIADAAVAGDLACGIVDYKCDGSEITGNLLGTPAVTSRPNADGTNGPALQQDAIPLPFISPFQNPNPCRPSLTSPVGSTTCWGSLIGWGLPVCHDLVQPPINSPNGNGSCEQPDQGTTDIYSKLPVPGSAGPNNVDAQNKCAIGRVQGLSIGYDGDVAFDVNDSPNPNVPGPNIKDLVNYHNFQPGPGGTDAPDGIDVESPLSDRSTFMTQFSQLRPGMEVNVCGQWAADMHMRWNELHPMTSLTILPDFSLSSSSSGVTIQAGEPASTVIDTQLKSGPSSPISLSVISGLPGGASATFSSPTVTPTEGTDALSTLSVSNLPVGDYPLTVQGSAQGVTETTVVSVHVYDYGITLLNSDETVLRGGTAQYSLSLTLVPGSSTIGVPSIPLTVQGLPPDALANFSPSSVTPTFAGSSAMLTVQSAGPPGGSLGDSAVTITGTDPGGTMRTASAGLHLYDFGVTVSPSSLQVLTTGSNTYSINVSPSTGSSATGLPAIALNVGGLPANATGNFSTASGSPSGFTSTLTITTSHAASSPGITLTISGVDARFPEGGSRSTQATLVVLTPAQAITLIIGKVLSFESVGVLNGGQTNSLTGKLNHAISSLVIKPPALATGCNQLNSFVNAVNGFVQGHILTQAQSALLLGGPLGIYAIEMAIPC